MSNEPSLPPHTILPEYDPDSGTLEPLPILQAFLSHRAPAADDLDDVFRTLESILGSSNACEGVFSILDTSATLITRVVSAPSQRTAYLVTSSSSSGTAAKYLCLLPPSSDCHSSSSSSWSNNSIYYCSCRSYLEKNNRSQHVQPCKHLLALILLPHIDVATCHTVETLTDEEFGRLLVRSTSSPI